MPRPRPRPAPAPGLAAVLLLAVALAGGLAGCGVRSEVSRAAEDGTLVRDPLRAGEPEAAITFCRKVGSRTGTRFGVGREFTAGEDEKVRALVDLELPEPLPDRPLEFHLVWLGPGRDEFYTKRVELVPDGPTATLESAISIPPGRRDPGDYALEVYLFRELIAEKGFVLHAADGSGPDPAAPRRSRDDSGI